VVRASGAGCDAWGLLLTPEETDTPRELAAVHDGPR
jgi:membrane glycosyltransferase